MKDVIILNDLSICFNMSSEIIHSFKEYVIKLMKKQLFFKEFWALKNINVTIKKGEVFGIVGLNGAGKSTLLKAIAGVLRPTSGTINVIGRVAPLIELGAGFDPELTARENIYLNGAILGYSRKFLKEKFDEIVDFSELKDFLDVPVKNFSSGMYARLGFSIATIVNPEILIVDEILSVGDFHFQEKCEKKIMELLSGGTTVIYVSHSIEEIEKICDRILWLEKGEIKKIGKAKEICDEYRRS